MCEAANTPIFLPTWKASQPGNTRLAIGAVQYQELPKLQAHCCFQPQSKQADFITSMAACQRSAAGEDRD